MMRWSLLAVGCLSVASFRHDARAEPVAPASGTWVGLDGRTYYVPPVEAPAPEPEEPVRLDKHGRPRRKVNVGMTVAGGVFAGVGLLAFVGGLGGYFGTIDCHSGDWFQVSCTDHKEILFVSLAGVVSAVGIGTPLLVVGLRRPPKNKIESPAAEDASLSFDVGPVSGLTLRF